MTDEARSSPSGNGPSGAQSPSNGSAGGDEYGARLRAIFENNETSRREKIVAALRLGAERFGVGNAHLVRIDPAKGIHTIVETVGDHPEITEGSDTALSRTYCRETIARQRPLTITDAGAEGWSTDPAFQRLGFSTYLGTKVLVDGTLYGTVCFADEAASGDRTVVDTAFLERLADDIGRAIARSPEGGAPETAPPAPARGALLERIQEVAEIGAWVYDADTDTVTGTGELYRLLGLSEGDTFDLETGLSFYPPDARGKVERAVRQCLEEGVPFDLTVPLVTKEGTRRWVRLRGRRHRSTGGGFQMTGTLQDVTDQKQIEETLEKERTILRRMYRITADRDASFDTKIERLIDLGCEYLDLPYGFVTRIEGGVQRIEKAQGTHPLLQPGESCPLSKSYCRKTIQEDSLLAVQDALSAGWADDPAFDEFGLGAYVGAKVLVGGELYGTFCFAAHEPRAIPFGDQERTFVELLSRWASYELERKRAADRLEQQNERLDRLARVVSHDLRNPLNVAQGRFRLVEEQLATAAIDGETEAHMEAVRRAHERIDTIIEDMMALTWSGQSVDAAETEPLRLREVAEACWFQVEAREATFEVDGDRRLKADEGRLRQLLENLFRNAVDHGGEDVTVRVGPLADGFYVEDNGTGLPETEREKLFEASYTTSDEGTGLGLSIAEAVADTHGWTISAMEGEDGGARFEITGVE